jgi:ubiquitin-protein ligase
MSSTKESMKALLNKMQNGQQSRFNVDYYSDKNKDPFLWKVLFEGTIGSIYEGGFFMVKIQFTSDYPKSRPSAYFLNKIFHPHVFIGNVNNFSGDICLNIKNTDINSVLVAIESMFIDYDKDVDHAYGEDPKKTFKESRDKFIEKAKEWVRLYAKLEDIDKFYDL